MTSTRFVYKTAYENVVSMEITLCMYEHECSEVQYFQLIQSWKALLFNFSIHLVHDSITVNAAIHIHIIYKYIDRYDEVKEREKDKNCVYTVYAVIPLYRFYFAFFTHFSCFFFLYVTHRYCFYRGKKKYCQNNNKYE